MKNYYKKRDFSKTPEPSDNHQELDDKDLVFVVQKHQASSLHYDFRLQIEGALESWAVPKGPSLDPQQKRLAVHVEKHPYQYKDFEGVIPEGEYGAGTVMVWDKGSYENLKQESISQSLENGEIKIFLKGEKLKGEFTLVKMKEDNWLLIKGRDENADSEANILNSEPNSALTGRNLKQIKREA